MKVLRISGPFFGLLLKFCFKKSELIIASKEELFYQKFFLDDFNPYHFQADFFHGPIFSKPVFFGPPLQQSW